MARTIRTRTVALAAVSALVLGLGGCNGDSEPDAKSGATASASTSPTDGSPSPSATESSSPSSSVAPATGPLLQVTGVQMNAPAGWKQSDDIVTFSTTANPPTGIGAARLGALAFPGVPPSLDDSAKLVMRDVGSGAKRLPDFELAGATFYKVAGKESSSRYTVMVGTVSNGYDVTIDFDFDLDTPAAERDKIVAESLASFAWE